MNRPYSPFNSDLLNKAFELAERGRATSHPNPMVGAVIVKDGRVAGEGWHERAGGPHAEITALRQAGEAALGGELYVSLEPCCHYGRTPPCTNAIIESGVSKVIVGAIDPNPGVKGQGIDTLRQAGIEVFLAPTPPEFARQNEVHERFITSGRPFVLLKTAASLNGMIAAAAGMRTKITGSEADAKVQELRCGFPAVAVGVGTALIDDPLLTCRIGGDRESLLLRVVIDSRGSLPPRGRLASGVTKDGPVLVATTERIDSKNREVLEARGVEVLVCSSDASGRVDLEDMLRLLGEREISGLLVEGGATVNAALLAAGLVDKMVVFYAPKVFGGPAVPMIATDHDLLVDFEITKTQLLGADLLVEAYPIAAASGVDRG